MRNFKWFFFFFVISNDQQPHPLPGHASMSHEQKMTIVIGTNVSCISINPKDLFGLKQKFEGSFKYNKKLRAYLNNCV